MVTFHSRCPPLNLISTRPGWRHSGRFSTAFRTSPAGRFVTRSRRLEHGAGQIRTTGAGPRAEYPWNRTCIVGLRVGKSGEQAARGSERRPRCADRHPQPRRVGATPLTPDTRAAPAAPQTGAAGASTGPRVSFRAQGGTSRNNSQP